MKVFPYLSLVRKKKARKYISVYLVSLFLLGGCSIPALKLDVSHNENAARKGPLSSIKPLKIGLMEFVDVREEQDVIGWMPGVMGKGRRVATKRKVPAIVYEAIASEFKKNGHFIQNNKSDISVSGEIQTFAWEYNSTAFTIESFGTVSVALKVVNEKTGKVIYTRKYQGHHAPGGFALVPPETFLRTMNVALEQMARQISTDPKLLKALKSL